MKPYESILIITLIMTAWYKYKGYEPFRFFLAFMMMVVLTELVIEELYANLYDTNYPVMNLFSKICTYYYLFVFYEVYKKRSWAGKLRWIILGFIMITLIWHFRFQDQNKIDYLSYNIGFFILMPLMLGYLYEVIYKRPYYNISRDPYIYFVFGLLLFYTSSFPILGFINVLITDNAQYAAYLKLLNIGNIFISLAYLGAVLCSKYKISYTTLS